MSAIFGIFHLDSRPVEAQVLAQMDAALREHGSDGGGVWNDGGIGLGARLMHFTPEDRFETQPLVCSRSKRVLVADARLNNRPELTEALGIDRAEAAALPDSAFILRAYDKWGDECVYHLLGAWAFALWDGSARRLLIASDPYGERGVCWHESAGSFAFATVPRGLLPLPTVSGALNENKLLDMLTESDTYKTHTFIEGVRLLPSGHRLVARREGVKIEKYYRPDLSRTLHLPRDEDYVEAFKELFDRVMQDNLRTLTPVGVMMSGGLDSAAIGATAARLLATQGERVTGFTEVPREGFEGGVIKGRYADETPYVQALAAMHSNLDVQWIRVRNRTFLDDAESLLEQTGASLGIAANRAWWETIQIEASAQGKRTLLNGMQGNVAFSWNGGDLLSELVGGGKWRQAVHEARASAGRGDAKATWRALVRNGIVPLLPASWTRRFENWRRSKDESQMEGFAPLLRPEFVQQHDIEARRLQSREDRHYRLAATGREGRLMYFQMAHLHSAVGRARFGLDTRMPLCDTRLVEWCLSVPETQCRRDGQPRWLVRRAMADRLPPEIVNNQKRGLQAADWLEQLQAARPSIEAEIALQERSAAVNRVLDVSKLRALMTDWPADLNTSSYHVLDTYRITLLHGVQFGQMLRWHEEHAP